MLTGTDLLALGVFIFALWHGWNIGLLRSILGPACFVFFCLMAIINFDLNQNLAVAGLIVVIGTTALSTLVRTILFLSRRSVDKEFRRYIFWGSRLLGSIVSAGWKEFLLVLFILGIVLVPANVMDLSGIQRDILFSQTYFYANERLLSQFPNAKNIYLALSIFKDPVQTEKLSRTKEFADFFQSPKVRALISDEGIKEFIAGKDFLPLLAHPKLKAVITDDELMATLTRLSRRIYEEKFKNGEKNL